MQLRYARIQVSKGILGKGGQVDTLIALGANLPAASTGGWQEDTSRPLTRDEVTTEDKNDVHSLPDWIRSIKRNDDPKKRIDAHA